MYNLRIFWLVGTLCLLPLSATAERMVSPVLDRTGLESSDLAIRLNYEQSSINSLVSELALANFMPDNLVLMAPVPRISIYTPEAISQESVPVILHLLLQGLGNLSAVTLADDVFIQPMEPKAGLPWQVGSADRVWAGVYSDLSATTRLHLAESMGLQAIAGQFGSLVYAGPEIDLSTCHAVFTAMNERRRAEVRVVAMKPGKSSHGLRAMKEYLSLTPADLVVDVATVPNSNALIISAPDTRLMSSIIDWLSDQSFAGTGNLDPVHGSQLLAAVNVESINNALSAN